MEDAMNSGSLHISVQRGTVTILFLIAISLASTHLYANECQTQIEMGDKYYGQFDNVEALKDYEEAYKICPESHEVLFKLTRAYNDVGEDLEMAAESDGSKSGEVEGYFENAIKHAKLLLDKFPDEATTFFLLAASHGNLGLFKGGKEELILGRDVEEYAIKAIEIDPNFDQAYVVLGIYYREVASLNGLKKVYAESFLGGLPGRTLEDSIRVLTKALELSPESPYVHYDLARTYEELGNKEKAIEHYNKVIELPAVDHDDVRKKSLAQDEAKKLNAADETSESALLNSVRKTKN
jgi:tetratricopeptide (TPR) repeat protein